MSEQKKKAAPETEKVETPKIPHVAYPLKPRSNTTNLSQQYFNHLAGDESARFLFNNSGLWHQGIHLRASKFPSSEFENNNICAIADGKLIAYKVDSEYKSDNESESSKESAVYSTGFFLLKHEVAYPKDNFLYVARGSQLYSIANDEAVVLEKSQVEIMVPLSDVAKKTVKKKTDKTGKDYYNVQPYLYSLPHKHQEGGIYVDSSHLTHGLLFPGVNIFNQSGNGLCIFKYPLHQNIDPKSDLTTEQKNELDPMFKSIMDELDLEKDKNAAVSFEAGKLKDLLLSPVQQRRLTGIVAKHDSEWKKTREADFSQTCGVYRANGKEEIAKRIEKRIADLSIKLEVDGFNTDKQAYYLHPLGMIGWLMPYSTCFCHRDFTVEEFKSIVTELRKGVLKHTNLWIPAISSGASPSDKTYEATVKELNRVMNKYEINTCLRKIHFLAQAYHETHYFQSMQEYTSPYTSKYDPYRGRGLIHLTHKKNYEKFSADMGDSNIVNNPSIVATNIAYAFESGGWFWKKGATLSNNKPGVWRYPNCAPKSIHERIKMEGANCNKSIVSYGNLQGTFGVLDLNVLADNDWGNTISWLINGGANGFDDRIKYRNLLKEIMKYELCKNKK